MSDDRTEEIRRWVQGLSKDELDGVLQGILGGGLGGLGGGGGLGAFAPGPERHTPEMPELPDPPDEPSALSQSRIEGAPVDAARNRPSPSRTT